MCHIKTLFLKKGQYHSWSSDIQYHHPVKNPNTRSMQHATEQDASTSRTHGVLTHAICSHNRRGRKKGSNILLNCIVVVCSELDSEDTMHLSEPDAIIRRNVNKSTSSTR